MLDNCTYNKIKLIHEISSLIWFIQKFGIKDAKDNGDTKCVEILQHLEKDLNTHLEQIRNGIC